ncbi:MAG: dihydrodipicolinate synthase family protein, partial [Clostridia bacterium]|nr:dihydrodipicolinate synthase family protein [Clostridia bacterium]
MKKEIFNGVCTAIVTPFKQNGKIDYQAFKNLIEIQIKNGIDAILVLGTTGEGSTISNSERKKLIAFARRLIKSPTKLIVGTGSNNTKTALNLTKQAQHLKADGVLIVTPYYNKCSQNGA